MIAETGSNALSHAQAQQTTQKKGTVKKRTGMRSDLDRSRAKRLTSCWRIEMWIKKSTGGGRNGGGDDDDGG